MVSYHQVTEEDFDELAMLLSNQWATPEIRDNPVAMKHSGLMSLYYFMVHHTFTCVAEDNGKVIGLLICTDVKRRPIDMKYARLLIGEVAYMICNPETRDDGLAWGEYTQLAQDLEEIVVGDSIDAEAELFVVAPEYRGQGIGKAALSLLAQFLFENKSADVLALCPVRENSRAVRCYRKCGFEEAGRFSAPDTIGVVQEYVCMARVKRGG